MVAVTLIFEVSIQFLFARPPTPGPQSQRTGRLKHETEVYNLENHRAVRGSKIDGYTRRLSPLGTERSRFQVSSRSRVRAAVLRFIQKYMATVFLKCSACYADYGQYYLLVFLDIDSMTYPKAPCPSRVEGGWPWRTLVASAWPGCSVCTVPSVKKVFKL